MKSHAQRPFVLRPIFVLLMISALQVPSLDARVELAPCKNKYSPEQQIELGDKVKAQVYKQMPVLPDSSPITQYIQQLGKKLTAQAPGYHWPYNFHVANVAEINAFALPGGSIFVNLGTIQAATDEAQLAGVMAHEISHVVLQHSVCNAEKQQRVGLLAGLGQIAAGIALGGAAGELAQQGIGMTAGLGFLKMSRGAEKEADLEGVGILYDAGYDPHGMPQFFEIIQTKYGEGSAQFLSDHPNPGNRTEYITSEIKSFVPRPHPVTTTPQFAQIHSQVEGMHAYTAKEISSGAWRKQDANLTVGQGVHQMPGEEGPPNLDTTGSWKTLSGTGFSLQIPGNWNVYQNKGSAMAGPKGGITRSAEGGAGNVVYGMLTDTYTPEGNVRGRAAMQALTGEITRDNPGVTPGTQSEIKVDGVVGQSIECNNPSANSGRGERDQVVAFQRADGALRYFVFVAPTPDFGKLQPTFQKILQSVRFQ